jgi:hypothetical protein
LGERYNTPEHSEAPKNSITDGDDAAIANNNTQTGFVDQNAAGNVLSGSDNDNSKITADAVSTAPTLLEWII